MKHETSLTKRQEFLIRYWFIGLNDKAQPLATVNTMSNSLYCKIEDLVETEEIMENLYQLVEDYINYLREYLKEHKVNYMEKKEVIK